MVSVSVSLTLFAMLFVAATVNCEDVGCKKGTRAASVQLNPGDSFTFKTVNNRKNKYRGNQRCTASYSLSGGCEAALITCATFNTRSNADCTTGDYLIGKDSNGEEVVRFCNKDGPQDLEVDQDFSMTFVSDRRKSAEGIDCVVSCITEPLSTTEPSTAETTSTASSSTATFPTTTTTEGTFGQLNILPETITVSGFSSGAIFANMFHIAFSNSLAGMASFAGMPYLGAVTNSVPEMTTITNQMVQEGRMDDLSGLVGDKIYIFHGTLDYIVTPDKSEQMKDLYESIMDSPDIVIKNDMAATHAFPSATYGSDCTEMNFEENYLVMNCGYSGAQVITELFYNSSAVGEGNIDNLSEIPIAQFFDGDDPGAASMDDIAFIYTPQQCKNGSTACHLHFHFHGCMMGRHFLGTGFIRHSGLLDVAEANNIVMVFPQIIPIEGTNDYGCWNFEGYLNDRDNNQFASKSGAQMSGMAKLMEHLSGISMF